MHKIKKIHKIIGISIVFVLFGVIIFLTTGIIEPETKLFGNNAITSHYEINIGNTKFDDIMKALESTDDNYMKEINVCNVNSGDVTIIFQKGSDDYQGEKRDYVIGYEFIHKQGFYYCGNKKIQIDVRKDNSNFTWIDSMRADLGQSTSKSYKRIAKKYSALPAWGITDQANIKSVRIDGQEIDEIITVNINGKEYYLWIIKDLQTNKHANDVLIQ